MKKLNLLDVDDVDMLDVIDVVVVSVEDDLVIIIGVCLFLR